MIYFFDGTKESFLTAFVIAYPDEDAFFTSSSAQLALGQKTRFIPADGRWEKAEERLLSYDKKCIGELEVLLRSSEPGHEQAIFRYFKKIAKEKRPVRFQEADPAVYPVLDILRRIGREIDRLYGFVRFMECASGALYGPISPDNDVCDLLLPHFLRRLNVPFVIHDVSRKRAAVYDGKRCFTAPLDHAEIVLSAKEGSWQSLWKTYYESVNIPSRERLKQMKGYMPLRYWKFMPEKQPPKNG